MTVKKVKYIYGNKDSKEMLRLFADKHKLLTNDKGKTVWNCVDVNEGEEKNWEEIDFFEAKEQLFNSFSKEQLAIIESDEELKKFFDLG